jgi:hypothetical protein
MGNKNATATQVIRNSKDLLQAGNLGLTKLLLIVHSKGQIKTSDLLEEYGSNSSGYFFLERARKQGLIDKVLGESEHGQFPPVYNQLSEKGRELVLGLVRQ